ncbi:hypothetical protein D0U04_25115 [Bacillus clarus]|uniref:Uncharacterized protein n=1 Tax=Bacillus clarus TaxID=2338372 RepID=A0A090YX14_9BACI|nr:hypothetical protein [Bacillus clarus]KFN03489.1 hypothetical protein DJ93_333 [Bacillus clarus]RFT63471.1 hypothetical protein D0U04_25115 [Bacillus clarus]
MKRLAKGKLFVSEGDEIIRHTAEVKRGLDTYRFEIERVVDGITVYFVDENQRKFMVVSLEEMLEMIPDEISQKRYRNIVDNAPWLLLDGIHEFRGMTKDEVTAFLRLKEEVLDDMVAALVYT